eukprot:5719663-Lingulodinium_polyedra.AAC.1
MPSLFLRLAFETAVDTSVMKSCNRCARPARLATPTPKLSGPTRQDRTLAFQCSTLFLFNA